MIDMSSTEPVKEVLADALKLLEGSVEYADCLYEKAESLSIRKDNVEEKISTPASIQGVVIRAYKLGQWRETSISDISKNRIEEAAKKLASFEPAVAKGGVKLQEQKAWNLDKELQVKIKPSDIDLGEKLEHIRRIYNYAKNHDKRIINTIINYLDSYSERIFANTEGSVLRQLVPRIFIFVVPIAKEAGKMDYDYLTKGGTVGFELLKRMEEKDITQVADKSIELLRASAPPSGHFRVILDPSMTGVFAHESFGHGCEADQIVRKRSYLTPYLKKQISFENLNIIDDGTLPSGNGSFFFDDEGIKSKKNYILRDGVLEGFLHERYSAALMNVQPTGNGRRESFLRKLFVRMTNTYIEPGDYSLQEMKEEIDEGIMLVHASSGMEDPLAGGMQLKSKRGYKIEKGEVTKVFSTLTLSENVIDFISSIDAVGSKDQFETSRGSCGKGHEDLVPVGDGGVYLRARAVVSQG